jgi:hypothetical protein
VSDSILYLAIVAIWAGFLVPAWVRRPHTSKPESDADTADCDPVGVETDVDVEGDGRSSEHRAAGSHPGAEPVKRRPAPGPSEGRQQMMRARRRMLTILASLVFITAAFVVTGLVHWWICVPPLVLLVLYVLLLREIAMADAELARKRAAWEARAARDVWRRAHEAWESGREAVAETTAEIIDISSRVGDQLYDQYADAAVRAVGD